MSAEERDYGLLIGADYGVVVAGVDAGGYVAVGFTDGKVCFQLRESVVRETELGRVSQDNLRIL